MNEEEQKKKELELLRNEIDKIDDNIIDLINERANIVIKIGEIKKNLHLDIYQPKREKDIIKRLETGSNLLKPEDIEAIWKEIIGACKVMQGGIIKVGYLGPMGTFTHQAALEYFPKTGTEFVPCKSILEIFDSIEKEIIEFGVIPIENSLQGTVRDTLDLLIERDLNIYGEIELRIIHNLISLPSSDLSKIDTIYSHPQAFAQTRTWIKTNLPKSTLVNINSTAEAVKKVKELNKDNNAAIGTEFSSKIYDAKILSSNIEDNTSNFTRFLIISKQENNLKEERLKTSLVYVTKHVPGALYGVLKIFADSDINLTKIESRPRRKGRWEYIFLMDFEGDKDTQKIKKVLNKLKDHVIWFKILGTYPFK
ncbi:MAG: prephenate dehydratase [Candidatus Hermodarchaeota archaeon]